MHSLFHVTVVTFAYTCCLISEAGTSDYLETDAVKHQLRSILMVDREVENQPGVVNPHPFTFTISNMHICTDKDVFLLVYIHSAPRNWKRRMIIRQTWGDVTQYKDHVIRVVFVMGRGETEGWPTLSHSLAYEDDLYHDLVQEDFVDSYKNLTYKAICALRWVHKYCPHAQLLMKTDDDLFVNMYDLLPMMTKSFISFTGTIFCMLWTRMHVKRDGKWKVSKDEFAGDVYPRYCSGSAFIMTMDLVGPLLNQSLYEPYFWVDDLYLTGFLPSKLPPNTVKHKAINGLYVLYEAQMLIRLYEEHRPIFSHCRQIDSQLVIWWNLLELLGYSRTIYSGPEKVVEQDESFNLS